MIYDLIIKNGSVIDPFANIFEEEDIFVHHGKIVKAPTDTSFKPKAKDIINAKGYIVIPGLIENHTHLYQGGSEAGYDPDLILLPQGVTSAIDQGTSGSSTFESFYKNIIGPSRVDIKAYLNISSTGLITEKYMENINPEFYDVDRIKYLFDVYAETIMGLKIRIETESCGKLKLKPLEETIKLAEELDCPVSVHVKNPNVEICDIANLLRKDDVWIHMFQLQGKTILDENKKVHKSLFEAKERGVLFDIASGRSGFSFEMINRAFEQGFMPDLLGTDLVKFNLFQRPIFSLLYTMSLYLNMGLSIKTIIKLCTAVPARLMGLSSTHGSLRAGYKADITIIEKKEMDITFNDRHGGSLKGTQLLVPKLIIKSGEIVYRNIEF